MLGQKKCCPQRKISLLLFRFFPSALRLQAKGDRVADLEPEAMLAAPKKWCPDPAYTISLLVKGSSMSPLILDGYIIAVDTCDTAHDDLIGKIVVAWNRKGLLVSRLIRFDHTDV